MYGAIQKPAEITTAPHPSTPESGGKVELKFGYWWHLEASSLDYSLQAADAPRKLKLEP
jgi:hypothetical protein